MTNATAYKIELKGQNILKGIIHDNDATHEKECVLKIDPEVKFWSILRTIWGYIMVEVKNYKIDFNIMLPLI